MHPGELMGSEPHILKQRHSMGMWLCVNKNQPHKKRLQQPGILAQYTFIKYVYIMSIIYTYIIYIVDV